MIFLKFKLEIIKSRFCEFNDSNFKLCNVSNINKLSSNEIKLQKIYKMCFEMFNIILKILKKLFY